MKHIGPISGVASLGTKFVATAGYDNQVILWNAQTRRAVSRAFHDHLVNQCAFNGSGNRLVTSSSDYSARVWSIPELRLLSLLDGHRDDVEMASFSPDDQLIATCSRDHTIGIFDVAGRLIRRLCGHDDDVISACWGCDGRTIVSCSDDGTVRKWNAATGAQLDLVDLGSVQADTVVVGKDEIIAGDDLGRITFIVDRSKKIVQAHDAGIKRLVANWQKHLLVSLSYDRTMVVWHMPTGCGVIPAPIARTTFPPIVWPRSACFIDDGSLAFTTFGARYATFDLATLHWDTDGIEPDVSLNALAEFGGEFVSVGDAGDVFRSGLKIQALGSLCNFLLPFGSHLLTGGQLGQLFDALSGVVIYQHRSPLNCGATFAKDGRCYAVIGSYTGEGIVLVDNGRSVDYVTEVKLHSNAVKGLAVNGSTIFSVCASGAVAFHKSDDLTQARFHRHAHTRIANGCSSIPGGFASVGRDLMLRLWNLDGTPRAHIVTPHKHSVKCVVSNSAGTILMSGSYDGSVAAYDVGSSEWVHFERPTAAGISCVTCGSDNREFMASSYDGGLYPIRVPEIFGSEGAGFA